MDISEKKAKFDEAYLTVCRRHSLTLKEALAQFNLTIDPVSNEAVQIISAAGDECFIKECRMLYRFCFHFE